MEITARALWALIHGMGFGGLYLLAGSGALVGLYQLTASSTSAESIHRPERFVRIYLITMVVLAWAAVLSGAYAIYPWYRAAPPPGTVNLSAFPQRLLMSSPATIDWHSLGMEWKEHVAWFAPISITMVAFVFIRYGRDLRSHRQLRAAVLVFTLVSLVAAGIRAEHSGHSTRIDSNHLSSFSRKWRGRAYSIDPIWLAIPYGPNSGIVSLSFATKQRYESHMNKSRTAAASTFTASKSAGIGWAAISW